MRFPVHTNLFHEMAMLAVKEDTSGTRGTRYLWLFGSEVRGMYASLECDINKDSGSEKILEYMKEWSRFVDKYNEGAWVSAKGAFHVSKAWVDAETSGILISSTINTVAVLLSLSFVGMFLITQSCALSMFVVMATLFVCSGQVFYISVVTSSDLGILEVIALIYFVGYALDYSLHIAHKYGSLGRSDEKLPLRDGGRTATTGMRFRRTKFALKSMGGATLSAAITTAGASLFLSFCTLTIFRRLGSMCLAVTVLSIFAALGPLPVGLLCYGPKNPGCCCTGLMPRGYKAPRASSEARARE